MFHPYFHGFSAFHNVNVIGRPKKAIVEERLGKQLGKGTGSDDKAGEFTFCRVKGCILSGIYCIYYIYIYYIFYY